LSLLATEADLLA